MFVRKCRFWLLERLLVGSGWGNQRTAISLDGLRRFTGRTVFQVVFVKYDGF